MAVAKSIIINVRDTKITGFLKEKGVVREDGDKGMELYLWVGKILAEAKITMEELNECLYHELMFGHRRFIRLYELRNIRKIKREEDWNDFLVEYDCPSMNFNRILQTNLLDDETVKIAAMRTNIVGEVVQKVDILFVYNMETKSRETGDPLHFYSYLPVAIDLNAKTITIKVWNKDDALEENTPIEQIDNIFHRLEQKLEFDTRSISVDPQKVLYRMSKALFDDFFRQLPNTDEVEAQKGNMSAIVNSLLLNVTLQNSEYDNGEITMNPEVINVQEEMYKLLQQVALYDYLKDNDIKTLLDNTDKYISRIRFSDRDNLTASLTSETGVKCIFDAKTFMCVRNSLDLVESIVSIVVSFVPPNKKGLLSVKYDASSRTFLNIHILNNRYYTEDEFAKIWELYKEYESEDNAITGVVCVEDNAEAM